MKKKKVWIILFSILAVIVVAVNCTGWYTSDIDCVNDTGMLVPKIEKVIYKYETNHRELLLYNSSDGEFNRYVLKKIKIGNKNFYKYASYNNMPPIEWDAKWTRITRNLKYIFVQYKDDIEDFDCEGYTPEGTKIHYVIASGEEDWCWIYIIDKTK